MFYFYGLPAELPTAAVSSPNFIGTSDLLGRTRRPITKLSDEARPYSPPAAPPATPKFIGLPSDLPRRVRTSFGRLADEARPIQLPQQGAINWSFDSGPTIINESSVYYPTAYVRYAPSSPSIANTGWLGDFDRIAAKQKKLGLPNAEIAFKAIVLPTLPDWIQADNLHARNTSKSRPDDLAAPVGIAKGEFLASFVPQWHHQWDTTQRSKPKLLDISICSMPWNFSSAIVPSFVAQWHHAWDLTQVKPWKIVDRAEVPATPTPGTAEFIASYVSQWQIQHDVKRYDTRICPVSTRPWAIQPPPPPPPPPPGAGKRYKPPTDYLPEPPWDIKPAKPFRPIWDVRRRQEEEAARNAKRVARPPLPPLPPVRTFPQPPAAVPSLAQFAPHDPLGLGQRLADAKDMTDMANSAQAVQDLSDAMQILADLNLIRR